MTDEPILLAKVQMPEKGVFAVRCPHLGFARDQEVVVNLGYGPDLGTVLGIETYDPAVHGDAVPGYLLIRAKTDEDARTAAAAVRVVRHVSPMRPYAHSESVWAARESASVRAAVGSTGRGWNAGRNRPLRATVLLRDVADAVSGGLDARTYA